VIVVKETKEMKVVMKNDEMRDEIEVKLKMLPLVISQKVERGREIVLIK